MSEPTLILVTMAVKVALDETKFTPEWIEDFERYMYPIGDVEGARRDLARLYLSGLAHNDFVEGYGSLKELGVEFSQDWETRGFYAAGEPGNMIED